MLDQIKMTLSNSRRAFVEDVLGTVAVFTLLFGALHLPLL